VAAAPVPGWRAARHERWGRTPCWRCPSRCTRPVAPNGRGPGSWPDEFPAGTAVVEVPGADHGFAVPRKGPLGQDEASAVLTAAVRDWLDGLPGAR
jgi:hypothetical protein